MTARPGTAQPVDRPGPTDAERVVDALANPPGRPRLSRRSATHSASLARMRDRLAAGSHDLAVRSLARAGTDDPAVALLDAWALVADTVSFYAERIASEGYLRTAVLRGSVRELARTLGHELRPGVAAEVDLAFTVDAAAEGVVLVPAGTPVQSVPSPSPAGAGIPQTFETSADLEARAAWNAVPVLDTAAQRVPPRTRSFFVRGPAAAVRPGGTVLLELTGSLLQWQGVGGPIDRDRLLEGVRAVGAGRRVRREDLIVGDLLHYGRWVPVQVTSRRLLTVVSAVAGTARTAGWVEVTVDRDVFDDAFPGVVQPATVVGADLFGARLRVFGWNAPDPNLLVVDGRPPIGADPDEGDDGVTTYSWDGFGIEGPWLDLDGDRPDLVHGSRVVLEHPDRKSLVCTVDAVRRDGLSKFAVSGPVTSVLLTDVATGAAAVLTGLDRRRLTVHAVPVALDAGRGPDLSLLTGTSVSLAGAADPGIPVGRRVALAGTDGGGAPLAVAATVLDVIRSQVTGADVGPVTLVLDTPAPGLARQGLTLHANVVAATHGETVSEVLGSGDARTPFQAFVLRRPPLTYVRAQTPRGARAALELRVDGVRWTEVGSLLDAGPQDRVYVVRRAEDGSVRVVLGDGVHGARPATGTENVTASYRTGIGAEGAVPAGSATLLPRRPLGVREVTNPSAAVGWAAAETLEEARAGAPMLVRTLDRAVSVADHEDFARGYAGVGAARADLLWDGTTNRVLVSVLAAGAGPDGDLAPGTALVDGVRAALGAARDPAVPFEVVAGEQLWFGLRVEVAHDPARLRADVVLAVRHRLAVAFGPAARAFADPVTAAAVLVAVRSVPGVAACTVPRLFPLPAAVPAGSVAALPPDSGAAPVLRVLPGRWDVGTRPAQLLGLTDGAVEIGEMPR